jgi:hypothetical protein
MRYQRFRRSIAALLACGVLLLGATPALADEYDPQQAGHPLRFIAYVLHPVGVVLDLLIVRPAHWLVSQEGLDEFFGHEPYDD